MIQKFYQNSQKEFTIRDDDEKVNNGEEEVKELPDIKTEEPDKNDEIAAEIKRQIEVL